MGWDNERTLLWNQWLGTADGKQYEAGWGDNENRERARRGESWVDGRIAERRANEAEIARLITLPNGTHIDPKTIVRIETMDGTCYVAGAGPDIREIKPRVCVVASDGSRHILDCGSLEEAAKLGDRLAAAVNGRGDYPEAVAALAKHDKRHQTGG